MEPPPAKKAKRRVPDAQRQRVMVSCDRCKTRKIRCIRLAGENDPCAACAQLSLVCESTLPRKQRVYASYDQLQLRYRALDSLVKRLYPDEDLETANDICNLAKRQGIDLTGIEEEVREMDPLASTISDNASVSGFDADDGGTPNESRLFASVHDLHIPEGTLIPAPRGGYHYVGPASSYLFANTIRQLVKKSTMSNLVVDRRGFRRQQRANEFASADRTTALEARIPGHPVMMADNQDASPSIGEGKSGRGRSEKATASPQDQMASASAFSPASFAHPDDNVLPPRPLADKLVEAFFDRVHLNFHIFHRGSFQVQYESLWTNGRSDREMSLPESGWMCALFMVFVLGAQSLERDNLPEATAIQRQYLSIVIKEGLQRLILTATLTNVHALALLGLYQHNAGERNTAWMLLGHASRMSVALGMQRDSDNAHYDYITRNSRRMTWWTLYLFEQNLSFILGRPSATSTIDISAGHPDEGIIDGNDAPPGYLHNAVKLADIAARIKRFVASISPSYNDPRRLGDTTAMALQLDRLLLRWERNLPPHLQPSAPFATAKHSRTVQLLHAAHRHLRSVLGRPYLLCTINHDLDHRASYNGSETSFIPAVIRELAATSISAARTCMQVIAELAKHDRLEGELWYDFYYLHHASLVLCLPFLLDSDNARQSLDRATVSYALNLARQSRLAPTYRILINVSIQFATIVGIGPDDDPSRPSSPRRSAETLFNDTLQPSTNDDIDQNELISGWPSGVSYEGSQHSALPAGSGLLSSTTSAPGLSATTISFDPLGMHTDPDRSLADYRLRPEATHSWSLLPVLGNEAESQPLSLEQLLSIQPSSFLPDHSNNTRQQPGEVSFSDMFNFGYEQPAPPMQDRRESHSMWTGRNDGSSTGVTGDPGGQDSSSLGLGDLSWDFFGALGSNEMGDRDVGGSNDFSSAESGRWDGAW